MQRRDPYRRTTPTWAGAGSDPADTRRRVLRWLSQGDRLVTIAVAATALGWLAYGWYAATAFADPGQSVPSRFTWELPTAFTVGVAAAIGVSTRSTRGVALAAALVAGTALGLLLGVILAGGFASAADDASYVTFVGLVGALVLAGWAVGVLVAWLLRRRWGPDAVHRHRTQLSAATGLLASLVTLFTLGSVAGEHAAGSQWAGGATAWIGGEESVNVQAAWWDAPAHAYLPRFEAMTVALGVVHLVEDGERPVSRRRWQAQDQDGTAYEAIVWPNRRPLHRLGQPLLDDILVGPAGTAGWIAFVVPPGTEWLDVSVETAGGSLGWRVDEEGGARVAS